MAHNYVASTTAVEQGLYVAYVALTTITILCIYFGSIASLHKWKNQEDKKRTVKKQIGDSDDNSDDVTASENLSSGDAYLFPVLGSMVLYGLHLAFHHLDHAYLKPTLTAYFCILSMFAMTKVGVNTLTAISQLLGIQVDSWHINLANKSKGFYSARFTIIHLFMLVVSVMLAGYYAATRHWIVSNVFGVCLALSAIELLSLDSFKTGLIFLAGLTLHDVAWDLEKDIMISVSKNFSSPLKVSFPSLILGLPAGQAFHFVTLGLGDIVIPGIFAALCLRFDQHRAGTRNPMLGQSTAFRKPYFIACLVAYVLGLSFYFYITHLFKSTQPVLLYLATASILSVSMTAIVRGETKRVFAYTSEAGLKAAKAKKEAEEKRRRKMAQAAAAINAPRMNRLPAAIKEESIVPKVPVLYEPAVDRAAS
ncbi:hypothetical protein BGX28_010359 [Mortierella sp. GBA30]|nr:hypothetical protein BGX28_010359 [Mortierella sp. GBA30]